MWMIDPKKMCRKHLLGEHGEIHKFRHNFVKKHNMRNRILLGQINHLKMQQRHDALAAEMLRRGYNHNSPYEAPDVSYIPDRPKVNIKNNIKDLKYRCKGCRVLLLP